jgi:hypothetical protein
VNICGVDIFSGAQVSDLSSAERRRALLVLRGAFSHRAWSEDILERLLTRIIQSQLVIRRIMKHGVNGDSPLGTPLQRDKMPYSSMDRRPIPASSRYVGSSTDTIAPR